jgi:hypothetical protein
MFGAVLGANFAAIASAISLFTLGLKAFPIPVERRRLTVLFFLFLVMVGSVYLGRQWPAWIYYSIFPIFALAIISVLFIFGFFAKGERQLLLRGWNSLKQLVWS